MSFRSRMSGKSSIALIICSVVCLSHTDNTFANKNIETSLLKSNQSFRSKFNAQPNLDKGEVTLPVQVSIVYVIKQSLPAFLTQLASRNKMKLTLSDQVSGKLEKISLPLELDHLLPELSSTYGLEWHIQGEHLFVSNSLENENRFIKLNEMNLVQLKSAITRAKLKSGTNKLSFLEDKNAVTLIGSKHYISKIETLIKEYQKTP